MKGVKFSIAHEKPCARKTTVTPKKNANPDRNEVRDENNFNGRNNKKYQRNVYRGKL